MATVTDNTLTPRKTRTVKSHAQVAKEAKTEALTAVLLSHMEQTRQYERTAHIARENGDEMLALVIEKIIGALAIIEADLWARLEAVK